MLQAAIQEQETEYLAKLQKTQAEIVKNMKSPTENISKAKIKRQLKEINSSINSF